MSSEPLVIRAHGVSKSYPLYERPSDRLKQLLFGRWRRFYRPHVALEGVDLEVRQGQTVGVIGRNGAGKSTLLKLLCGKLQPSSGRVGIQSRVAALLELGTGFNPEFTGRENVYLNAAIFGLTRPEIDARFAKIAAFAELGDFIERPVKTYSSGMMMRLAFSVVVHVDADILVIDESLAVGDIFFVQKCMRFLRAFSQRGTLLLVSHSIPTIASLCDQVLFLDHGRMRMFGDAKTVCEAYSASRWTDLPEDEARGLRAAAARKPVSEQDASAPVVAPSNGSARTVENRTTVLDSAQRFGVGGAKLVSVDLRVDGRVSNWCEGGERVELEVAARLETAVDRPVVGFYIKDRRGQNLFGENTFETGCQTGATVGATVRARFVFTMPVLPVDEYLFDVAVGTGTQDRPLILAWYRDVLKLSSRAKSPHRGLVGIAMESVELEVDPSGPAIMR